jgi:hypothetical protein
MINVLGGGRGEGKGEVFRLRPSLAAFTASASFFPPAKIGRKKTGRTLSVSRLITPRA